MDVGATSLTVMLTVAVSLPPALVAVIVYEVEDDTADGVPLMSPDNALNDKPAGRVGEIDQEVTGPPVDVGVAVVIPTPLVRVIELVLYVTDGAASLT